MPKCKSEITATSSGLLTRGISWRVIAQGLLALLPQPFDNTFISSRQHQRIMTPESLGYKKGRPMGGPFMFWVLVLLALVHQFDVHRGEGRGGGGQDDRGRGGDGGSLCASEMCVHAARSTARVDDHTSRLASRTVRRRRRRESEFEFESDGCGRTPAIRSIDRSAIAGILNSTNGGRRDARWRDARASIASV